MFPLTIIALHCITTLTETSAVAVAQIHDQWNAIDEVLYPWHTLQKPAPQIDSIFGAGFRRQFFVTPYASEITISGAKNKHGGKRRSDDEFVIIKLRQENTFERKQLSSLFQSRARHLLAWNWT